MARILICSVNWIGDSIMSMPALQAFRKLHPEVHISLLVKPHMRPLWNMHHVPNELITLQPGHPGVHTTAHDLYQRHFDQAYILPNSFRSALIPYLSRIPSRVGRPGHGRRLLLTDIHPVLKSTGLHQSKEYAALLLPENKRDPLPDIELHVPPEAVAFASSTLDSADCPIIGILPGAARGPSKQWPAEHFAALSKKLQEEQNAKLLFMGGPHDATTCEWIESQLAKPAMNMAGKTTIEQWAALLSRCDLVICNDSGGMHLAAALNRPLIAMFGTTDPAVTGPLCSHATIMQRSGHRQRDISKNSEKSRKMLASILPQDVYDEAVCILKQNKE